MPGHPVTFASLAGTNDAKDEGSGGPTNWQHDCGAGGNATTTNCVFADDYKNMINLVRTLGEPTIYTMTPIPLMQEGSIGANQTIINSLYPALLPLINADNEGVLGPIDLYTGFGGREDWQTYEQWPTSCTLDSDWDYCLNWCDAQNCDQCHPNDDGYAYMAKLVQQGLGL
jgi:lysophospholipase L1-like esterase